MAKDDGLGYGTMSTSTNSSNGTIHTIGLLGSTGRVGGWVLIKALEKGHNVRALVRTPSKLASFQESHPSQLTLVQGSSTDATAVGRLIETCDVAISTLGSPNKETLVVTESAQALVDALEKKEDGKKMRIFWMTTIGVNDAVDQGHAYGCADSCCPSCRCCCGYGPFGCLVFNCLIPCVISHGVWDDMGESELVLQQSQFKDHVVIVRPTNMWPPSEHAAFTDEWREEGGDEFYQVKRAEDPPPNMWITRRAIAAFFMDAMDNMKDVRWDGQAVSLFQGQDMSVHFNSI